MTVGEFTDDIMVTMGFPTDDSLRAKSAVGFNVMMAVNKINDQILTKALTPGADSRNIADLSKCFVVNLGTQVDLGRRYFDLPVNIYSLPSDGGMAYVRYHRLNLPSNCAPQVARVPFTQVTTADLTVYWGSTNQRPSPSQPYFTRESSTSNGLRIDRVYVWGLDSEVTQVEAGLFVAIDNLTDFKLSDQLSIPPEYLSTLKKLVLESESWMLNLPLEMLRNDGRQYEPGQVVRTPPVISVNAPAQADA